MEIQCFSTNNVRINDVESTNRRLRLNHNSIEHISNDDSFVRFSVDGEWWRSDTQHTYFFTTVADFWFMQVRPERTPFTHTERGKDLFLHGYIYIYIDGYIKTVYIHKTNVLTFCCFSIIRAPQQKKLNTRLVQTKTTILFLGVHKRFRLCIHI